MKFYSLKFKSDAKIADYKVDKKTYQISDDVLVDLGQAVQIAKIIALYDAENMKYEEGEGKILRKITIKDKEIIQNNKETVKEYVKQVQQIVKKQNIKMQILDAHMSYDQKKLTFYFSASSRVDFRRLVSDLVKKYKKLIRLQQIGPREQVKKMGGYGKCGERVCCARFLDSVGDVDMSCAEAQNMLDMNTKKLNGLCGKMMCCMAYENEWYAKRKAKMPRIGDEVKTNKGKAKVLRQDIMNNKVLIKFEKGEVEEVSL